MIEFSDLLIRGYLAYLAGARFQPLSRVIISIHGASSFDHGFVQKGTQLRKQVLGRTDVAAFLDGGVTTVERPAHADPFQSSESEAILFDEHLDGTPSADYCGVLVDTSYWRTPTAKLLDRHQS